MGLRQTDPGEYIVRFIQRRLYEPAKRGKLLVLRDWQQARYRAIYGTLRPDGKRQYTRAFLAEAKKNGKSTECAALASYHLFPEGDGVYGAEVYSGASSRGQATIIYRTMKQMLNQSPKLRPRCKFYDSEKRIYVPESESFYQALSADADFSDGINPSFVIADELHRHKNRELWDLLLQGSGTRDEPLIISITTAGDDKTHFLFEEWKYAEDVLAGRVHDPQLYAEIWAAALEDDWEKEDTWHKANPALGDFLNLDDFRTRFNEAKNKPMGEASFRRLRLNQWIQAESPWLHQGAWDACPGEAVDEDELAGRDCFGFLDLSASDDFTALVWVFPNGDGSITVVARHWIPEESIAHRGTMRPQIQAWVKAGALRTIDGPQIDQRVIKEQIRADLAKFRVLDLGFDPWACRQLAGELTEEGAPMAEVRPFFSVLHEPTHLLTKLVYLKHVHHGSDPVLAWQTGNVVLEHRDNFVRPSKNPAKTRDKIDAVFALIGAVQRWQTYQDKPQGGVACYIFD